MKYALIGCGRISPNHLASAIEQNLEIVAVCDVVKERAEEKKKQFNLPDSVQVYTDYKLMLEEQKPNLVAIATESGKHAAIALDCIDKEANLIIEKPIALSLSDADKIIEAAERKGVKVCACHQNRFNKSIRKIRESLEEGRFGKLLYGTAHIRWNRGRDYYEQAPWRGTYEQDGGALMNQCIHGIDLLRWMMGDDAEEIYGVTKRQFHDYLECEDIGMAVVKFKNGAIGTIEGTTNVYPKNLEETLYLFGEKGTVKLGGKSTNAIDVWDFADEMDTDKENKGLSEQTVNVYGNGHTSLFADVIDAIVNDRPPYVDARAGARALETVLAIYKSSFTGKPVKLPLEDCSAMDFVGKFDE